MFGDIMAKLQEAKKKVEETKERLNTVLINEISADKKIKITITANREIKSIEIDNQLLKDKEQLEDLLIVNLNRSIKKATEINEKEIADAAKDGIPNIPGL